MTMNPASEKSFEKYLKVLLQTHITLSCRKKKKKNKKNPQLFFVQNSSWLLPAKALIKDSLLAWFLVWKNPKVSCCDGEVKGSGRLNLNLQLRTAGKYWNACPSCLSLFPFPTPAVLLNETRPTTKHTSGFIPFTQLSTASLSQPLNILSPSTSQTCCISHNDSKQFGVWMAFPLPVMGKCVLSG